MTSRLSHRLAAFLCAGLLALTVLVGTAVTLPLKPPSFAASDVQSHNGSNGSTSAVVLPHIAPYIAPYIANPGITGSL